MCRRSLIVPQLVALSLSARSRVCARDHKASARVKSSCSKALAMRLISAARTPTILAISRQVAVTVATSLTIVRAGRRPNPKYCAALSNESMLVVSTRALRWVGTGFRSKAGDSDQPGAPSRRNPWSPWRTGTEFVGPRRGRIARKAAPTCRLPSPPDVPDARRLPPMSRCTVGRAPPREEPGAKISCRSSSLSWSRKIRSVICNRRPSSTSGGTPA